MTVFAFTLIIRALVSLAVFVDGLVFLNYGYRFGDVVKRSTLQLSPPVERLVKPEQLRAKFQSQVETVHFAVLRSLLE